MILGPVVNQPSSGQEISVHVVEIIAPEALRHISLVGIASVVSVLPSLPLVLLIQLLGQIPFPHRWLHVAQQGLGTLRAIYHCAVVGLAS